ncbi:MAG: exo-alpha-sialidase [Euryarchaeota archaeon]|nr:exo-alpha-sialidase [Euryarchaeota archaeon]
MSDECQAEAGDASGTEFGASVVALASRPQRLVAAWQQDWSKRAGSDVGEALAFTSVTDPTGVEKAGEQRGGGRGVVVALSSNGGRTWQQVAVRGLSECDGTLDPYTKEILDARLAVGPDDRVYLVSAGNQQRTLYVTSSLNGHVWEPVSAVAQGDFGWASRPLVAADPGQPGRAWVAWDHLAATSVDSGRTWSAKAVYEPEEFPGLEPLALAPLPSGPLLAFFISIAGHPVSTNPCLVASVCYPVRMGLPPPSVFVGARDIYVANSTDNGTTWGALLEVGSVPVNFPYDPEHRDEISYDMPSVAVSPLGGVYVAWSAIRPDDPHSPPTSIMVSRSTDGAEWSEPATVHEAGHGTFPWSVFGPTIAVAADGTVAVSYFDFRADVEGDEPLTTHVWLSTSTDEGATWSERSPPLAGPFDILRAPRWQSWVALGNDFGLTSMDDGFGAVFPMPSQPGGHGATDEFFVKAAR